MYSAMKSFTILVLSALFINYSFQQCGKTETMENEGLDLCCYLDTENIPTIGYGFNLKRNDAKNVMAKYGLNLTDVIKDCQYPKNSPNKKSCLKQKSQALEIFNDIIYPENVKCVDNFVPNLPKNVKSAIMDMAMMGCPKLAPFKKMKEALLKKNWTEAANQIMRSKWCYDVKPNRCNRAYECVIYEGSSG
jgi:GH24 family phage-related lysozyme (muramidase)